MEGQPKKKSPGFKVGKSLRAAMAGAAFLGAAGMAEAPRADTAPLKSQVERSESFDVETEAAAFLEVIAALEDSAIQDARGRRMLMDIIDTKIKTFALAIQQQKPYFSKRESGAVSISGSITPGAREYARQILRSKVPTQSDNFAIQTLHRMLNPGPLISPETKKRLGDW